MKKSLLIILAVLSSSILFAQGQGCNTDGFAKPVWSDWRTALQGTIHFRTSYYYYNSVDSRHYWYYEIENISGSAINLNYGIGEYGSSVPNQWALRLQMQPGEVIHSYEATNTPCSSYILIYTQLQQPPQQTADTTNQNTNNSQTATNNQATNNKTLNNNTAIKQTGVGSNNANGSKSNVPYDIHNNPKYISSEEKREAIETQAHAKSEAVFGSVEAGIQMAGSLFSLISIKTPADKFNDAWFGTMDAEKDYEDDAGDAFRQANFSDFIDKKYKANLAGFVGDYSAIPFTYEKGKPANEDTRNYYCNLKYGGKFQSFDPIQKFPDLFNVPICKLSIQSITRNPKVIEAFRLFNDCTVCDHLKYHGAKLSVPCDNNTSPTVNVDSALNILKQTMVSTYPKNKIELFDYIEGSIYYVYLYNKKAKTIEAVLDGLKFIANFYKTYNDKCSSMASNNELVNSNANTYEAGVYRSMMGTMDYYTIYYYYTIYISAENQDLKDWAVWRVKHFTPTWRLSGDYVRRMETEFSDPNWYTPTNGTHKELMRDVASDIEFIKEFGTHYSGPKRTGR